MYLDFASFVLRLERGMTISSFKMMTSSLITFLIAQIKVFIHKLVLNGLIVRYMSTAGEIKDTY